MSRDEDYYTDDDGVTWHWEWYRWVRVKDTQVGDAPHPPLTRSEPEWRDHDSDLWRWWTGTTWTDLYASKCGTIDLARKIGQDIIAVYALGGADNSAIKLLREKLSDYPPVRIVTMTPYTSPVAPGTNLVAVVEWESPKYDNPDDLKETDATQG